MQQNGVSKLDLKRINRSEILRIICCNGPISRIELAKQLHLTRAAMTIICSEMIEQGILYECGESPTTGERVARGRKKVLLDICENHRFSIGIVLNHRSIHIGLATLKGKTLEHLKVPIDHLTIEEIVEVAYEQVQQILQRNCLQTGSLLGIGACLSGMATRFFPKAKTMPQCLATLKRMMEIRFAIPVSVGPITQSLALAEQYFFPDRQKPADMLFVRYDYDLDAAIMLRGELHQGEVRSGDWFGHVVVDTDGDRCTCGKIGCCCTKMSIQGIIEKIKVLYQNGGTPALYQATGGDLSKVDFELENLEQVLSEPAVKQLYQEALLCLVTALGNVATVLNPTRIVLFGFVFEAMVEKQQLEDLLKQDRPHDFGGEIIASHMTENRIYLAGNGRCVKHFFVDRGAL